MKLSPLYGNEQGAVLVISLMFLVILGLLGTTAVVMTTTDIKIGENYSDSQKALFNADAGINFGEKMIEAGLRAGTFSLPTAIGPANATSLTYTMPAGFSFSLSNIEMMGPNSYSITSTGSPDRIMHKRKLQRDLKEIPPFTLLRSAIQSWTQKTAERH